MGILYNRFLEIRFMTRGAILGGRQEWDGSRVLYPPKISIDITHSEESNPNEGSIKIWNMAPTTQRDLLIEGDRIEVEAGYWPHEGDRETGLIFRGQIGDPKTRYEGTHSISEIPVTDSEDAYIGARTRQILEGSEGTGPTHREMVEAAVQEFRAAGVEIGRIDVPEYRESRPRTEDRLSRLVLDDIAYQHDLVWHIQDNVFNMYPRDQPLEIGRKILTPETGVIGVPQFTSKGVDFKCLMLHSLRPGEIFELVNDNIVNRRVHETLKIDKINFSGNNKSGFFGGKVKSLFVLDGEVERSRQQFIGNRT